ncbi:hypothetical protein K458DRAFT_172660 [Lentithecium fluviatile CBS 122367]|uniref:Uncharacterized protein n=1 Tax=Lentithecium fluviatile CBS 122367 TaxID=1168545 RepID=A0A6G1JCS2_9PLEO|nr:hypothetical protein K458DRAFT_172660 [Lentithecium fluviatile CBS 122367]
MTHHQTQFSYTRTCSRPPLFRMMSSAVYQRRNHSLHSIHSPSSVVKKLRGYHTHQSTRFNWRCMLRYASRSIRPPALSLGCSFSTSAITCSLISRATILIIALDVLRAKFDISAAVFRSRRSVFVARVGRSSRCCQH